jgi:hypothetical protein
MAGPLNGIGGQQQIPLATPFQPGQNGSQVRGQDERSPKPNQVQQPSSQLGQVQEPETRSSKDLQSLLKEAEATGQTGRGSVIDITI